MSVINLSELKREIAHRWRVQSVSKRKALATCVAYISARDVMNLLDDVVGPENWYDDYKEVKGNLFAGISIKVGDQWITKWDIGNESNIEKDKGAVSDAFKRAAVKWGIGRFLYEIPNQFAETNEPKNDKNNPHVIDSNGKQVWDLTTFINAKNKSNKPEPVQPTKEQVESQDLEQFKQKTIDNCRKNLSSLNAPMDILELKNKFIHWADKQKFKEAALDIIESECDARMVTIAKQQLKDAFSVCHSIKSLDGSYSLEDMETIYGKDYSNDLWFRELYLEHKKRILDEISEQSQSEAENKSVA